MSPEVLRGDGYDWKSDIWSLGCLLYELAMLRSPFKSEGLNLYSLFQKISKGDYAPLPQHYSSDLKELAYAMIRTEPQGRPDIEEVCTVADRMREATANQVRCNYARLHCHTCTLCMLSGGEQASQLLLLHANTKSSILASSRVA
jgi:serine/threonine protein kinase